MTDIVETGVTWDHDFGDITISTRKRSIISKLKSLGFKPLSEENPQSGYTTFREKDSELGVTFRRRKQGKSSQAQRDAMAKARASRRG